MWYLTTRVAARSMIPHGYGKVVSVTMTPQRGIPYMAHSSAARAAVESLTQTLAVEWGQYGIRIVAVAPGIVHTEAWEGYGLDPATVAESMLLKRLQAPRGGGGSHRVLPLPRRRLHHGHHAHRRRRLEPRRSVPGDVTVRAVRRPIRPAAG